MINLLIKLNIKNSMEYLIDYNILFLNSIVQIIFLSLYFINNLYYTNAYCLNNKFILVYKHVLKLFINFTFKFN